ncbi:hypothetical protein AB0F30_16965 [Streptomyces sp. NPDC029006]|uniref:hypothetical protein n=1 Tax=Streptomyces sp. NPDC029006 TaxID=3155467 RepID=UPI0033D96393
MGRKLAASVYVTDPDTNETVLLEAGTSPDKRLADLVTNPVAWEGEDLEGNVTAAAKDDESDATDDKQAAKKTTAARKPARGRDAADEGTSGD